MNLYTFQLFARGTYGPSLSASGVGSSAPSHFLPLQRLYFYNRGCLPPPTVKIMLLKVTFSIETNSTFFNALIMQYWYHLLTCMLLAIHCECLKVGIGLICECGYPWIHSFIIQNITSSVVQGQALIMKMHINITLSFQSISCLWFFSLKRWNRSGIIKTDDFIQAWTLTVFISLDLAVKVH